MYVLVLVLVLVLINLFMERVFEWLHIYYLLIINIYIITITQLLKVENHEIVFLFLFYF